MTEEDKEIIPSEYWKKHDEEFEKQMFGDVDKQILIEHKGYLFEEFTKMTDFHKTTSEFIKTHPIYYDDGKNWWIWSFIRNCYVLVDETDMLNAIDDKTKFPTTNATIRNEIIEGLRRAGRKSKPMHFHKDWIQFKDKVVNFRTGETFEISPKYFSANPIPWEIGDSEETPTMDKLFKEWVGEKYVQTLYEILAYCLVSDYPLHRIFCFYGSGLNGKGCFMRLLKRFIGVDNCTSTELELLLSSRFEITRLYKKLACIMTETNFEELSNTAMLKKITGQDLIGFEYKNKTPFSDTNYAKVIISTNNLPPTADRTIGFYRRWSLIDFPNRFEEGKDIVDQIPEEEFRNLAKKSIKNIKILLDKGKFTNDGTIDERAKRYEDLSNPFDKFWRENIEEETNGYIGKKEFHDKLNDWCKENRFRNISHTTISKKMGEMKIYDGIRDYYKEGERKQYRVWNSLKWKDVTSVTDVTSVSTPLHTRINRVGTQVTVDTTDTNSSLNDTFVVEFEKMDLNKHDSLNKTENSLNKENLNNDEFKCKEVTKNEDNTMDSKIE